ncbi:MAG: response regulator transcription factor [Flavobacteriia bacterium]|nr:response regulator transcription factor [Flavobacteriia bacterium]
MKCCIIEDEFASRQLIKMKLNQYFPNITVINEIDNIEDGKLFLSENEVDFIFLDIEIKGGQSFIILDFLKSFSFEIIFITAYDQYALKAFTYHALHYILKPFQDDEFIIAIQRTTENFKKKKKSLNRIFVPSKNDILMLPIDEIYYIKSDGQYTTIHTENRIYTSTKSLGEYYDKLDKSFFFRVHHSFIVNVSKMLRYEKKRNGLITLLNEVKIPISQRKLIDFERFISKVL